MSPEAALPLLVVALYLKDCLLLLRPDEALMVAGVFGPRWRAAFGPRAPAWRYFGTPRSAFAADFISGANRTRTGNTLKIFDISPGTNEVHTYTKQ